MNTVVCDENFVNDLIAEIGRDNHVFFLIVGDETDVEAAAVAHQIDGRATALVEDPLTHDVWWLRGDTACLADESLAPFGLPGPDGTLAFGYGAAHALAGTIVRADVEDSGTFDPTLVALPVDALIFAAIAQN